LVRGHHATAGLPRADQHVVRDRHGPLRR
jgi:hypothetical protein